MPHPRRRPQRRTDARRLLALALAYLLVAGCAPAHSARAGARVGGGLSAGEVFDLVVSPPGRKLFATTDPANIYEPQIVNAVTFTVNSTGDAPDADAADGLCDDGTGSCTLRAAIGQANAAAGADSIRFNIPGAGVQTIAPASALPTITEAVTVDGYTQPGASPNTLPAAGNATLLIDLDAAGLRGLHVAAGPTTIRGLVIRNATEGVLIESGDGNVVEGNFIGTNPAGTAAAPNVVGIVVDDSDNNRIGGTTPAARNVISGNTGNGLELRSGSDANTVAGNFVGTNAAGTAALGNGGAGLLVNGSANNLIGGTTAAARNVISANDVGVELTGAGGNVVQGNHVGTLPDGAKALGNLTVGVAVNASNNTVGGAAARAGNTVAFNGSDGVSVVGATGVRVSSNLIHSNGGSAIDLGADAQTPNDAGDADAGANNLQNFPVLAAATSAGGSTTVTGTLNSEPSKTYTVEFFSGFDCEDAQGFLGSAQVTTDAEGNAAINAVLPEPVFPGEVVSATAIDPAGNTSELSLCVIAASSDLVVTTTADGGAGSLRQAVLDANAAAGAQAIVFNIPGAGPHTISPASALPTITDPVVIDGYTQPGASANTLAEGSDAVILIELDGSAAGAGANGLAVSAGGSTVRGLAVLDFGGAGVLLTAAGGNTVAGNFIGTNAAGAALPGTGNVNGVVIENGSAGNTVGGSTPAARNLISGNDAPSSGFVKNGVVVRGAGTDGNTVAGNYIGTNPAGTALVPNGNIGVFVREGAQGTRIGGATAGHRNLIAGSPTADIALSGAGTDANSVVGNFVGTNAAGTAALGGGVSVSSGARNNRIGGASAGERNVIAATSFCVSINGAGTTGNTVRGNYVGTSASGAASLNSGASGVSLAFDASGNEIGGAEAGEGNVISGLSIGVFIFGASNNTVRGNLIGADAAGTSPVPNQIGVAFTGASIGNRIGGTTSGAGNLVAFNSNDGVSADGGAANSVLGNSIHSNGAAAGDLGIDLSQDGVAPNDANDADAGPNGLQNFPVLSSAVTNGGTTTISGTLNSVPSSGGFRVEFFLNPTCDASGHGEGRAFVGALNSVSTDAAGNAALSFSPANALPAGRFVTATATDEAGNTSEFSPCVAVSDPPPSANLSVTISDAPDPVTAGGRLTYTIGVGNDGPDPAANVTLADTLPAGVAFVSAASTLPGASCAEAGGTVNCNLGTLDAGVSRPGAVTIVVNAPAAPTTVSNTVNLNSQTPDPDGANNAATATTTVTAAPVFSVAGRVVNSDGASLPGVTLTLSGSQAATAQTDAAGNYAFNNLAAGGNYTVTPSLANHTFAPASRTFNNLSADQSADFTGTLNAFAVAGRVTSGGAGLAGVAVTLSGSRARATQTDANGDYSFANLPAGGSYTVTPSLANFTFTPQSRTFDNLAADQTADFTAALAFVRIRGRVADENGQSVAGVAVALADAAGTAVASTQTDAAGNYSFTVAVGGSYSVTPSRALTIFSPPVHFFANVAADQTGDFNALDAFNISGNLRDLVAGVARAPHVGGGVVVTLSGTRSATTVTDAAGNYSFAGLPLGGDYRVTPQDSLRLFDPPFLAFANLGGNSTADFGANPNPSPTPTPPIVEDFGGAARDPDKFSLGTLTQPPGASDELVAVAQEGGKLVVTPRANFTGLSFNGYVTAKSVDFTNATASIEVNQIAAGGAQTVFAVGRDEQNFFRFVAQEREVLTAAPGKAGRFVRVTLQQLILQARVGGVFAAQPPLVVNYDPVAHKYWRFRHDTTTSPALLRFEASPTGQEGTYVLLRAVALPGDIGSLATEIGAGTAGAVASPGRAIFDNLSVQPPQIAVRVGTLGFSDENLTVAEGAGSITVRVRRAGGLAGESRVELASEPFDNRPCATTDGRARARCDFATTFARLSFAPGESEKAVTIFVTDDVYAEGAETFRLALGNPSTGFTLDAPVVTVRITDDDAGGAPNPVNSAGFFVRQQYRDFLSREPDAAGFDAWTNVLLQCAYEGHFGPGKSGSDPACDRILVSSGFYRSDEFHARGFFVYRFYEAALGRLPLYEEFLGDMQRLAGPQTPQRQEANKRAFVEEFMARAGTTERPSFAQLNGSFQTGAAVDALLARAGVALPNRNQLVADLEAGRRTPAETLRLIAESEQVSARFYNRAFVAMQYFGYLQRDPEPAGFQAWLSVLDRTGDFRTMIFGFLYSAEYQSRFGPAQ